MAYENTKNRIDLKEEDLILIKNDKSTWYNVIQKVFFIKIKNIFSKSVNIDSSSSSIIKDHTSKNVMDNENKEVIPPISIQLEDETNYILDEILSSLPEKDKKLSINLPDGKEILAVDIWRNELAEYVVLYEEIYRHLIVDVFNNRLLCTSVHKVFKKVLGVNRYRIKKLLNQKIFKIETSSKKKLIDAYADILVDYFNTPPLIALFKKKVFDDFQDNGVSLKERFLNDKNKI